MLPDFAIDLGIDAVAIFLLAYVLYFRRHRRADLLLAYVSLNIGIFVAMSLLGLVRVDVALGFGLFAILSIIRLRSTSVTQQEVAYYFVALVMGLANGLNLQSLPLILIVNALLLLTMLGVDSQLLRDRARRLDITLDTVHADDASLVADLERRLRGTVLYHDVNEIDHVRGTMLVDVRYRAGAEPAGPAVPERQMEVTLDVAHTGDPALVADLERRLGGRVLHHRVKELDFVRDVTVVEVRYQAGWPLNDPRATGPRAGGPGGNAPGAPPHGAPRPRNGSAPGGPPPGAPRPGGPHKGRAGRERPGSGHRHHRGGPRRRRSPAAASVASRGTPRVSTVSRTVKIAAHRPSPRPLIGSASRPPTQVPSPPAERAVAAAAAGVAGIGLDELLELAELQTRVDRKYFVPADIFQRLILELSEGMKVLHIDGRRTFGYESVYFDTPQFTTYKAHVQRRRQRFKARTRTYTDTGLCMFEVKLTGARGETVKERVKHPAELRNVLTPDALRHLHTTLRQAYGHGVPPGMAPVLTTTYRRATFVSRTGDVRLTCDVGLVCRNGRNQVRDTGTHVLVESKSAGQDSGPDEILRDLGVRPASVSKYCVGIAALHPDLPSNNWHRTLRRYFGPLTTVG